MLLSFSRFAAASAFVASLVLSSCATPPARTAGTPEFYWAAAGETYAAGEYLKTLDDLDQLVARPTEYTARASVWRMVVTSGMARGYMDLADRYTLGARINQAGALSFRLRATKYRTVAAGLALRFAQQTDAFRDVPLGNVPLAFGVPKGNAAEPPLLSRIGSGIEVTPAEQESAETMAVQRGVLMAVCAAAGASNDVAKARDILEKPSAHISRAAFGDNMSEMLKTQSALFARDKLDQPQKLALFQERAERVHVEGDRVGSARIGLVVDAASGQ